ncbi:MAG: hypothetical protein ABIF71_04175 [Planctomycetota bacterium]
MAEWRLVKADELEAILAELPSPVFKIGTDPKGMLFIAPMEMAFAPMIKQNAEHLTGSDILEQVTPEDFPRGVRVWCDKPAQVQPVQPTAAPAIIPARPAALARPAAPFAKPAAPTITPAQPMTAPAIIPARPAALARPAAPFAKPAAPTIAPAQPKAAAALARPAAPFARPAASPSVRPPAAAPMIQKAADNTLDFEIARMPDPAAAYPPAAPAPIALAQPVEFDILKPKAPTTSEVTNIYEENDFLIAETKRLANLNNGLEMSIERIEAEKNAMELKAASLEGRVQALEAAVRTMTEYLETIYADFGGDVATLPANEKERVEMIVDTLVAMLEGKHSGA